MFLRGKIFGLFFYYCDDSSLSLVYYSTVRVETIDSKEEKKGRGISPITLTL
jgi:hypothetical protein